ncbi:MAG: amidase [Rhodospirillales bacterium]|nr:amidase [Rhodospirillales bacterium]
MTISLPVDPLATGGLRDFAQAFRDGRITAEAATKAYLDRIAILDPKLGAYQHVNGNALAQARAMDALRAVGTDLGPLMGVPIAIKDLIAVDGMPTTAGSHLDVADIIGGESSFARALKRAGVVVIGKTKTVEFALGAVGISASQGTPWNPWDAAVHRIPGGSSSGSAVAVAAGLAAFCGVFGLKTTSGLYPTDGVFPLSPSLDTLGFLTRSAADAAIVHAALDGEAPVAAAPARGLRLGRPAIYFYDDLQPDVAACMDAALARLVSAGVEIVLVDLPEAMERERLFPTILPADLIAILGRERFLSERGQMDAVVAARASRGLDTLGSDYIRARRRVVELEGVAARGLEDLDGWITPMAALVAPAVTDFADFDRGLSLALTITRGAQPANMFGLAAASTPIHGLGASLPVGLQLMVPAFAERRLLALSCLVENLVGPAPRPDLGAFV